jgi:hypothetical protein
MRGTPKDARKMVQRLTLDELAHLITRIYANELTGNDQGTLINLVLGIRNGFGGN